MQVTIIIQILVLVHTSAKLLLNWYIFSWSNGYAGSPTVPRKSLETATHSLTHCCAWPARAVATSTTSDPEPMTTASRLCTRDPLPPVVSRSSLAGQVDASSRGQGICPARGWHSAGGCCRLAHLVVGSKNVLTVSVFCQLWWEVDPDGLV